MPAWDDREKRYLTAEEIADRKERVRDRNKRYEEYLKHKDELPPFNWGGVFRGLLVALLVFGFAALIFSIKPDNNKPDAAVAALKAEVERARLDAKFQTSEMKEKLEKAEAELKADEKGFLETKLNELKPSKPVIDDVKNQSEKGTLTWINIISLGSGAVWIFSMTLLLAFCFVGMAQSRWVTALLIVGLLSAASATIFGVASTCTDKIEEVKAPPTQQVLSNVIEVFNNTSDCTLHENCKVVVRSAKITDVKQEGLKTVIYVEMEDGKKGSWGVSAKFLALRKHLIGEKIPIYEHHIEKVVQKEKPVEKKEEPKKTKEPRLEWL